MHFNYSHLCTKAHKYVKLIYRRGKNGYYESDYNWFLEYYEYFALAYLSEKCQNKCLWLILRHKSLPNYMWKHVALPVDMGGWAHSPPWASKASCLCKGMQFLCGHGGERWGQLVALQMGSCSQFACKEDGASLWLTGCRGPELLTWGGEMNTHAPSQGY